MHGGIHQLFEYNINKSVIEGERSIHTEVIGLIFVFYAITDSTLKTIK